ncbi:MAG: hypothetical protein II305_01180, partial [Clostridia bacterium]|nr:hypothetical protein [Clostridia bacterium]
YYKLGADITLNEGVLDADYNLNSGTFTSWTSGGTFSGVFDGDGHTIYGFYSTQQNGGLFSTVKGTIKNLKMKDAAYKLTWTVFGILASKVSGATIENVEVDGAIIGNQTGNDQQSRGIMVGRGSADFIGCIVRGKVVSTNVATVQRCGGFIGVADSTTNFTNCVNYADLGDLSQVGGFAGLSTGAINFTDCINYGNITSSTAYASYLGNNAEGHSSAAGGFVGVVYKGHPNFTRCANEGTIIGDSYAGGLIGVALNYYHTITLNNIYNIGAISAMGTNGLEYADDFIGHIYNGVANKISVEAGNLADYRAGAWLGDDADLWTIRAGKNPTLKLVAGEGGEEPEAPHEHAYTAETTPATCTEAGKTVYTCECGDSYEEVIPAKGHTEVTETVDATCTVDGATIVKCSVCGTTISATVIPATGHTYVDGKCECGDVDALCVAQVGDKYFYSFADAYAAAEAGDTITLLADITADAIITIDKAITLDGNGKTLTSTAGRAINVDCAGAVTIEDLTIVAKGERAINIINQPANVTVNNVTATAKNYAIMMATSAAGADLVVNDSD